jgi:hypothetical protein
MKWLVSATETLFDYGSKQYSDYNFPNFRPDFNFNLSLASSSAIQVCGTQWDCLYDYMTTGSAAIANQTKAVAEQFNQTVQLFSANVSLCPTLSNPKNGFYQVPNYFPESIAIFSCFDGYEILGDSLLYCNNQYQWNGTAPICTADVTASTVATNPTTGTNGPGSSPAATTTTTEPDGAASLIAIQLLVSICAIFVTMRMHCFHW